jgi:ketosteroid isomerase-like protein
MFRLNRLTPLCALALSMAACAQPGTTASTDTSADLNAIKNVRLAFSESMSAGDATRLMTLYAPDAVVMNENEPAITGHDAILANDQKTMAAYYPMMTITADETKVMGDWAYDRGHFSVMLHPKDAANAQTPMMTQSGDYVVLLQRQPDKSWKITREINNSNTPMGMDMGAAPTAPTAPKAPEAPRAPK